MANALATQNDVNAIANLFAGGDNPFAALGSEMGVPTGAILKFSGNTGAWTYKNEEIDNGTLLAFDIMNMRKGWVCWKGGKPVEKFVSRVMDRAPIRDKESLPDYGPYKEGEGWSECIEVPVKSIDTGEEMEISLSSRGGVSALARLASEFGTKVRMNIDASGSPKIPLVTIDSISFESQKAVGKKWAPVFKIVEWATADELLAQSMAVDEELSEEPVAVEPAPAPAPAPAAKPAATTRRLGQRT
jgi:hypothetical protein